MDDPLRGLKETPEHDDSIVLILIVMDDPLRVEGVITFSSDDIGS